MILNDLGFANRRLYLTPHFFRNKPTERLIGEGVAPAIPGLELIKVLSFNKFIL
jgi:transposase